MTSYFMFTAKLHATIFFILALLGTFREDYERKYRPLLLLPASSQAKAKESPIGIVAFSTQNLSISSLSLSESKVKG